MLPRFIASVCVVLAIASGAPVYAEPTSIVLLQSESNPEIIRLPKNSSLGKIKFGMSERQIRRLYGRPLKINRSQYGQCGEPATRHVEYIYGNNLRVELGEAYTPGQLGVETIETKNRRYQTDKGIRVGDSITKARAAYPDLKFTPSETWLSVTSHYVMAIDKQGKITQIWLGYSDGC